jgi:hypothetical protein
MRSSGKSLVGRHSVFVCVGVAGSKSKNNRTTPIEEFRLILEAAAGATWLSSLPSNTKSLPSTIVIVSKVAGEAKKQLSSAKKVAETLKKGAISKTTEEMFFGINDTKV